jgi:hypothetical protein
MISALCQSATAAVIFDDLGYANPTAASLVGYYPPQMIKNAIGGVQFQPQLHPSGTLHRVTEYAVAFRKHAALPPPLATFRLYDDAAGKPGAVIDVAQVVIDVEGFEGATYRMESTAKPIIASGGRYWLIANVDDLTNGALWHHALFSPDPAKTKAILDASGEWRVIQQPNGAALQVVGEPIPEPSACVLVVFAASVLLLLPARLGDG